MLNLIAATLLAFVCGSSAAIATFTTKGEVRTAGNDRRVWIAVAAAAAVGAVVLAVAAYRDLTSMP